MSFGPDRIFFDPGGTKNMGDVRACSLVRAVRIFVDLYEFVLDLKEFFWAAKVFVFDPGFCFLDPCTC